MNEREAIRKRVWGELRCVAKPDSRFHWDFTAFIPDFEGSANCAATIREMGKFRDAQTILVTPDNNLASLRAYCLTDHKTLVVPTYALSRGFWQITREDVPPGHEEFAATLDGLERFARPYPVEAVGPGAGPTLLITGASVINTEGVRISSDPSYFDLEWLILRTLGMVNAETPIVAAVHDCQLVEWPCEPQPVGSIADVIVTPTRVFQTSQRYRKPDQIVWEHLAWDVIREVPMLMALYERDHAAR
ncbi:MAG: hypothetical protein M1389_13155 [Chloroflexi bacterium]|nr:hypothetical protein [Chloroflexota bacterium]